MDLANLLHNNQLLLKRREVGGGISSVGPIRKERRGGLFQPAQPLIQSTFPHLEFADNRNRGE